MGTRPLSRRMTSIQDLLERKMGRRRMWGIDVMEVKMMEVAKMRIDPGSQNVGA